MIFIFKSNLNVLASCFLKINKSGVQCGKFFTGIFHLKMAEKNRSVNIMFVFRKIDTNIKHGIISLIIKWCAMFHALFAHVTMWEIKRHSQTPYANKLINNVTKNCGYPLLKIVFQRNLVKKIRIHSA